MCLFEECVGSEVWGSNNIYPWLMPCHRTHHKSARPSVFAQFCSSSSCPRWWWLKMVMQSHLYLFNWKKGPNRQWVLPRRLSACGLWFVAFLPPNSPQFWHHATQPTTNKNDFFFTKLEDRMANQFWHLCVLISVITGRLSIHQSVG